VASRPASADTTSPSRPSISSWPSSTASTRAEASSSWPPSNRPEILDPALLRPGRFDRKVVVDRPDLKGRAMILRVHTRGVTLAPGVDLTALAARTPGFVGADLANLVNEAALGAARANKNAVEMADFDEAIDRMVGGVERSPPQCSNAWPPLLRPA